MGNEILMENPDHGQMNVYTTSEKRYNEANGWKVVVRPPVLPPKEEIKMEEAEYKFPLTDEKPIDSGAIGGEVVNTPKKQPWVFVEKKKGKK